MRGTLSTLPLLSVVGIAYGAILTAELAGDKALYTVASLALRFPRSVITVAMAMAFAAKMSVAVLLGNLLTRVPPLWIELVSAGAFLVSGVFIWTDGDGASETTSRIEGASPRALLVCFAALFIPEWGDPGQITAAALTAQAHSGWGPWLGGTLALITKGVLALTLGVALRQRVPRRQLRLFASACCCTLAVVSLSGLTLEAQ
jgi:putative Ca2+/H+ antiporter (TMEM165/GDT1 family)